jgi:hypothetical protein
MGNLLVANYEKWFFVTPSAKETTLSFHFLSDRADGLLRLVRNGRRNLLHLGLHVQHGFGGCRAGERSQRNLRKA